MAIITHSFAGDNIRHELVERTRAILECSDYPDKHYPRFYIFNPSVEEIRNTVGKGKELKFYDFASRTLRLPNIGPIHLKIPRYYVGDKLVRVLPDFIVERKQYPDFVIQHALESNVTSSGIFQKKGNSDKQSVHAKIILTPCDKTVKNWCLWYSLNVQVFLEIIMSLIRKTIGNTVVAIENVIVSFTSQQKEGWLRELTFHAYLQKRKLVRAPW